ncbi:MAG: hypothetical protein ACYCS7_10895 [Acidimicrobiales bacterium]
MARISSPEDTRSGAGAGLLLKGWRVLAANVQRVADLPCPVSRHTRQVAAAQSMGFAIR